MFSWQLINIVYYMAIHIIKKMLFNRFNVYFYLMMNKKKN